MSPLLSKVARSDAAAFSASSWMRKKRSLYALARSILPLLVGLARMKAFMVCLLGTIVAHWWRLSTNLFVNDGVGLLFVLLDDFHPFFEFGLACGNEFEELSGCGRYFFVGDFFCVCLVFVEDDGDGFDGEVLVGEIDSVSSNEPAIGGWEFDDEEGIAGEFPAFFGFVDEVAEFFFGEYGVWRPLFARGANGGDEVFLFGWRAFWFWQCEYQLPGIDFMNFDLCFLEDQDTETDHDFLLLEVASADVLAVLVVFPFDTRTLAHCKRLSTNFIRSVGCPVCGRIWT